MKNDVFLFIAGPCVIETEDLMMRLAEKLKIMTQDLPVDFYFKASFDKANRTNINSYRGPGIEKGIRILEKVKHAFAVKIVTDIHEP